MGYRIRNFHRHTSSGFKDKGEGGDSRVDLKDGGRTQVETGDGRWFGRREKVNSVVESRRTHRGTRPSGEKKEERSRGQRGWSLGERSDRYREAEELEVGGI